MKKVLMAALLVAVFAGMAMAQPADETANVTVNAYVGGVWSITLSTGAVNFGSALVPLAPGASASAPVTATVRTNQKIGWGLQLNTDGDLENTTFPGEIIPAANLTFNGVGGLAAWGIASGPVPSSITTVYTADALEYKNLGAGTPLLTTLSVLIPTDAVAGTYTNVITYTLTANP